MVSGSLTVADVREILARFDVVDAVTEVSVEALTAVGDGVNDVLAVDPPRGDAERFVLKIGTFSTAANLRAGVAAARALREYTTLPVPAVLDFDAGSEDRPPAVAMAYCDGRPLARDFHDVPNLTDPARVSLLGAVLGAFDALPDDAATGWGNVRRVDEVDGRPHLTAGYDAFDEWVADYTTKHFENPVDHPAIKRVVPDALEYFQVNRHRLPRDPSPSVVITDLSPGNLLAPGGRPPASVDGLAGVIDLERAKLGPVAFTAVNLETLLTSDIDDPRPVQDALYEPLPFDPEFPLRDVYRLVALSRPLSALSTWEDPQSDAFDRRGRQVARDIRALLD
jgi:aminoglycoside phosphotransferase (APT) family kinase protein